MVSKFSDGGLRPCCFSHHSAEVREDGALSDGGDDMTPEQFGMGIFFYQYFLVTLFVEIGR